MEAEFSGLLEYTQMIPPDDWRRVDGFAVECRVNYCGEIMVVAQSEKPQLKDTYILVGPPLFVHLHDFKFFQPIESTQWFILTTQ